MIIFETVKMISNKRDYFDLYYIIFKLILTRFN